MNWLIHELRLLGRSRLSVLALALLATLAALSVTTGLWEITSQRQTLTRLADLQAQDLAALSAKYGGSAGDAAYHTFYGTWDQPSDLAFAATGMRDVAPLALRVRALGLQAQFYEGETFNPELALAGRFDFAFVLIYLAPLFVIALLHDLVSGERQAGRLHMLQAIPGPAGRLWMRRAGLRLVLVFVALAVPLAVGAALSGSGGGVTVATLVIVAAYTAFWGGLSMVIATRPWSSTAHATALMGLWMTLTLLLPALANMALTRAVPVGQGVDLMLTQRQNVHAAWEVPRETTMQKFFLTHPEWRDTPPLPATFHWKWYLAFHQLGDESVAEDARAYRSGLLARQKWSERLGWFLPSVGAQMALHRLAATDLPAHLAYLDQVEAFHETVRKFYYPFIFDDRPFDMKASGNRPQFMTQPHAVAWPLATLLWLAAWAGAAILAGAFFARSAKNGICRRY